MSRKDLEYYRIPNDTFSSAYTSSMIEFKLDLARRRTLALAGNPRTRAALGAAVTVTNTGSTEFNANIYQRTPNTIVDATSWSPFCVFEGGWTYYNSNRVYIYSSTRIDPTTADGNIPTGGGHYRIGRIISEIIYNNILSMS